MSRRSVRSALATLAFGLGLAFAAAEMAPLPGPPLYDGVVPVEAYRWLVPPPGEHGGAQGASEVLPVSGGTSPLVAVATPELTPQAQVFAAPGGLTLPPARPRSPCRSRQSKPRASRPTGTSQATCIG